MAETRTVKVTIQKVSGVDGRDGPQWELETKVPWSQYPIKLWMEDDGATPRPTKGDIYCTLTQGKLFDGKTGENDYDYRWYLKQLNVDAGDNLWEGESQAQASQQRPRAAPESASRGQSRGNPQRDATGISIERQVAMKEARPATEWLLQMQPDLITRELLNGDGLHDTLTRLYMRVLDDIYDHILARIQEVAVTESKDVGEAA